jgi:hypothetical protein
VLCECKSFISEKRINMKDWETFVNELEFE